MEIPPDVSDDVFEKEFIRGVILLTEMQFRSGERKEKFLIVLNQHPTEVDTLLFLTTSQAQFYDKHPHVDHVRIEVNKIDCFHLETVIDCREVFVLSRSDLRRPFGEGILRFAGNLPEAMMTRIDQIVAASRSISLRHKKAILGWQ